VKAKLVHPTVDAVLAIHREVLAAHGGSDGLRSRELLESAVAAPQATIMGNPLITDPIEIAAAYFFHLCSNHPFADGNNRVALATTLVFLSRNGLLPAERLNAKAWDHLTMASAAGKLTRGETTEHLKQLLAPSKPSCPSARPWLPWFSRR
jgi:death-on-curing protein